MTALKDKTVLVTGGTGSFGHAFARIALDECEPRKLIMYSRDELKQHEMRLAGFTDDRMRFFIGDVRDRRRMRRAMEGVDVVIHAAALKQVPACEYNPIEAVRTNIHGAINVIEAAIDAGVSRVIAISTDKAVAPINMYGATKLAAEKLFTQSNSYAGGTGTRFSCCRYGNVAGSRGSVIPLFKQQRGTGKITITHSEMTRFWLTISQGVRFVLRCLETMRGGEVFVPMLPSFRVYELAQVIAPGCEIEVIGMRPGEKLHEMLLSGDESQQAKAVDSMFILEPAYPWWREEDGHKGMPLKHGCAYSSGRNQQWLTGESLIQAVDAL